MIVGWMLFAFALVRLLVCLANRIAKPYLPRSRAEKTPQPEVSVLIPARNEELRIGLLLEDLGRQCGAILEILVYDDRSTDATAAVVRRAALENPRIRLLAGGELPPGWQGKNHACHRLALEAAGRYLLFLDADVRLRGEVVARAVAYARRTGVGLLSLFPRQLMPDRGTRLAVPLMNWILVTLLPLEAVRRVPQPALSAANGQFMLFEAATYRAFEPHLQLRADPVEDIAIARLYKRSGQTIAVLLGREVECTMYDRLDEAVSGFSKNFFSFFGGSEALCYLFAAATTAAPLAVFLLLGPLAGTLYLLIIVLIRILVSRLSGQSATENLLLMIPQQIILWRIVLRASVLRRRRRLLWKGRNIFIE